MEFCLGCRGWLDIEQLFFFAEQWDAIERAIRLYEKLGFEQEGLLRMTTVRNGRYVDEYKMARIRPGVTAP